MIHPKSKGKTLSLRTRQIPVQTSSLPFNEPYIKSYPTISQKNFTFLFQDDEDQE